MIAPSSKPLPYTANPLLLVLNDLWLFIQITFTLPPSAGLPSIIFPIGPTRSKGLDELALTWPNAKASFLHLVLVVAQILFLVSLFPLAYFLVPALYFLYIVAFVLANQWFTVLLNGRRRSGFQSNPRCVQGRRRFEHEQWVFINGVAVGDHWLQANLDRLAMTFRRPVIGIHNQTRGIIFDVLECIIQRTLGYPTLDIRQEYEQLLAIVSDPSIHKVVLIVHSQGAIEGGMVLDWLYATVAAEQIRKLEVYTFGNAANHWNAPVITVTDETDGNTASATAVSATSAPASAGLGATLDGDPAQSGRVVKHIEHYANTGDYVSRFGILHFRPAFEQQDQRQQLQLQTFRAKGWSDMFLPGRQSRSPAALAPADKGWSSKTPPRSIGDVLDWSSKPAPASGRDDTATPTPRAAAASTPTAAPTATPTAAAASARQLKLATTTAAQSDLDRQTTHHQRHPHLHHSSVLSPKTPIERIGKGLGSGEDDNKFVGRLFKRVGSGHQFNQHYLDNMFEMEGIDTRDLSKGRVRDGNAFMDADVDLDILEDWDTVQVKTPGWGGSGGGGGGQGGGIGGDGGDGNGVAGGHAQTDGYGGGYGGGRGGGRGGGGGGGGGQGQGQPQTWGPGREKTARLAGGRLRVKHLSRLWAYRNGGEPDEPGRN
ncbi:hypothetical protein A1O3_01436 [Capronia epimyces CBS 606.96]|uniref:DUF676 domain-containing protein n=1 Tax=Capronia epimyces CBS 606.96 TaxID=1182542 RepID=W9YJ39_9EURO|nr:uncharacterized protein A1O3_01436 [Capronia epimyces CBS 606.96]EXJ92882.1 hypothetical protein A1O3_01436 [Capronia epimyces CBS 606.96]